MSDPIRRGSAPPQVQHAVVELHPPDMTVVDYWKELEALVLLLIVRMLDYEGFVYAAKFGASQILLQDYLEPATSDGMVTTPNQEAANA